MVLPMPESAFALYSVDSVKQRTPLALSWPILFFGACRSIMRIRTFEGSARSYGTRGNGGCPPLAAGWPGGPRSFASPACAGFAHKFYIKKAADCAFPVNRRFYKIQPFSLCFSSLFPLRNHACAPRMVRESAVGPPGFCALYTQMPEALLGAAVYPRQSPVDFHCHTDGTVVYYSR